MTFRPTLLALSCAILIGAPGPSLAATTFSVSVPASTPVTDTVFIAGDFQAWNPGNPAYAMTRQADGRWSITLGVSPGQSLQFKFTRGSWAKVEKGYNGEELANRTLTVQAGAAYTFAVLTWADLGTVTGDVESFTDASFLSGRRCWVYLPPGYAQSMNRYPVLYMQDGQNLFDVRTSFSGEWHVDETCDSLIRRGEIEPIIVVGIENGPARIDEYTPWFDSSVGGGGGADAYLDAVRDVLVPEVNRRYRSRTGSTSTYIAGSSLGGLLSAYAAYAYDATFGRVAAISPSYWWDNRMIVSYAQSRPKPAIQKFYQDAGTSEGSTTIDDLRAMHAVATSQGFQDGVDFDHVEAAGGQHNESFWAQRLPAVLRFLIDAPTAAVGADVAPVQLALAIHPNPASGAASFEIALPRGGSARLDLFDVTGRRLRTLAHGQFGAGRQVVRWDGRVEGHRAPAGIYWARLEQGGRTVTRRVVTLE